MTGEVIEYPEPRILLIDLDDQVEESLIEAGFNVSIGSFGKPYFVTRNSGLNVVCLNHEFSTNAWESDVVIIDLSVNRVVRSADGVSEVLQTNSGASTKFDSEHRDSFDPRLVTMKRYQMRFDRILEHGGLFLVFTQPRTFEDVADFIPSGGGYDVQRWQVDSWNFLNLLFSVNATPERGNLIIPDSSPVGDVLSYYVGEGTESMFTTTLSTKPYASFPRSVAWHTVAVNKYNEDVAVRLSKEDGGEILLFPQIADKSSFLTQLLKEALPSLSPHLFPYHEIHVWMQDSKYEVPRVLKLKQYIESIKIARDLEIADLEVQIERERQQYAYLYELLTAQGDELVEAVQKALEVLGFENVVNVDELYAAMGKDERDEDLRIDEEGHPLQLVEVKGISGTGKDEDVLAVGKYLAPRMRELDRTDIRGLTIINHQKHLPPLDRADAFRDLQVDNALQQGIGLMTTWTLFRLVRACQRNGWSHEDVLDLFYQDGVIEPIPSHYELLGIVERVFENHNAVGIIPELPLSVEDKIAFELDTDFIEETVSSLQVHNKVVDNVEPGEETGIGIPTWEPQLREGTKVYKVK